MIDRVLVTAAYKGELDQLDPLPEGWVAQPAGIGGVAAAAGLSMLITVHQPTRIIALGTCGALGSGLSIGSLVSPRLVRWVDPNILAGNAHLPPSIHPPLQLTPWPDLPPASCLQTPSLTLAAEHATLLKTLSEPGMATVEHLELYSMAFVAHSFGIPLTAILGVTNLVGPNGSRDWQANHSKVEALIQAAVYKQATPQRRPNDLERQRAQVEFVDSAPTASPTRHPLPVRLPDDGELSGTSANTAPEAVPEPEETKPEPPTKKGRWTHTGLRQRWFKGDDSP